MDGELCVCVEDAEGGCAVFWQPRKIWMRFERE